MKKTGTKNTSEHFNTAGRNVGAGLTAAVIVSQWTWAATLLQSSNVGWQVGVSGPFWCALSGPRCPPAAAAAAAVEPLLLSSRTCLDTRRQRACMP